MESRQTNSRLVHREVYILHNPTHTVPRAPTTSPRAAEGRPNEAVSIVRQGRRPSKVAQGRFGGGNRAVEYRA